WTTSLAPVVEVTGSDPNGLPDGTTVTIDADLNGDGDFLDAGEAGYATGTLHGGAAFITLPAFSGLGTYSLQARVTDPAGNQGTSPIVGLRITDENAPPPPVFTGISPDTGLFANDQLTPSQNLTLSGLGAAGATITLYRVGLTGSLGTTTANSSGAWS